MNQWEMTTKRLDENQVGWYKITQECIEFVTFFDNVDYAQYEKEHYWFVFHGKIPQREIDYGLIEKEFDVNLKETSLDELVPMTFCTYDTIGTSWEIKKDITVLKNELSGLGIDADDFMKSFEKKTLQ